MRASSEAATAGGRRIHVALTESFARPGGLHSYIGTLAVGQQSVGLRPSVLHNVRGVRSYDTWPAFESPPATLASDGGVVEYHFALSASRFVYGPPPAFARGGDRLLHFHGPWFREGRVQGDSAMRVRVKRAVEALTYRRFSRIVTASEAFAAELRDCFPRLDADVRVVHPGVDTTRFTTSGTRSEARERLGLPTDVPLIVCVRRLEPRMGIAVLIQAMTTLPEHHLVVVGAGTQASALRELAAAVGVAHRVRFAGRVPSDDLPAYYRAADVSCVPTAALEGFGMVVLESMASGTPVVATDVGGLVEAMGPFANEFCVTSGAVRPEAIAERLLHALAEPELDARVADYARTCGPEAMARAIEDVITGA